MSKELKPCPFCGGEAQTQWRELPFPRSVMLDIFCPDCLAEITGEREKAIAAWNRRADRWIPVSERLPEKEGHYFVTAQLWNGNTEAQITYWTGPEREPSNQFNLHCRAVTAWRPLPQPYEEEK